MATENGFSLGDLPVKITDIINASKRIKDHIKVTSCEYSREMSKILGMEVYLKKEMEHSTRSFKERGAVNTLMSLDEEAKKRGVVTASTGNHASGVSLHGSRLNIPVTIVMPTTSSDIKAERCKGYGANVIRFGTTLAEAFSHAMDLAKEHGYEYIDSINDPRIIAGSGTIALEIINQMDHIDAIVIPMGGGGLASSSSITFKELKPTVKVIGVQTHICHCIDSSLKENKIVHISPDFNVTIADGLAASYCGPNTFNILNRLIDEVVVVHESHIPTAHLCLAENSKIVVEGAGAAGVAAAIEGKLDHFKGKRVVFVLTGGNIDMPTFVRSLEMGMVNQGKCSSFSVVCDGSPSQFIEVMKIIDKYKTKIKNIEGDHTFHGASVKVARFIYKVVCPSQKMKEDMINEFQESFKESFEFIA